MYENFSNFYVIVNVLGLNPAKKPISVLGNVSRAKTAWLWEI